MAESVRIVCSRESYGTNSGTPSGFKLGTANASVRNQIRSSMASTLSDFCIFSGTASVFCRSSEVASFEFRDYDEYREDRDLPSKHQINRTLFIDRIFDGNSLSIFNTLIIANFLQITSLLLNAKHTKITASPAQHRRLELVGMHCRQHEAIGNDIYRTSYEPSLAKYWQFLRMIDASDWERLDQINATCEIDDKVLKLSHIHYNHQQAAEE